MSRPTVHRIWKAFGLQPHRTETFKLSTDQQLIEKVRDIVGLYLNPPERALVLCADEKSQIPGARSNPADPANATRTTGRTHDYKRNGTSLLFAALDVAHRQGHRRIASRAPLGRVPQVSGRIDSEAPTNLEVPSRPGGGCLSLVGRSSRRRFIMMALSTLLPGTALGVIYSRSPRRAVGSRPKRCMRTK